MKNKRERLILEYGKLAAKNLQENLTEPPKEKTDREKRMTEIEMELNMSADQIILALQSIATSSPH